MARPCLDRNKKFQKLVKRLGSRVIARGSLELMWDGANECGDPTFKDKEEVELSCGWEGEPNVLYEHLVECGFIDEWNDVIEIHDFWDHAPDYVFRRAAKEKERKQSRVCEACGMEFRSTEKRSKFCSHSCRQKTYRKSKSVTQRDAALRNGPSLVTLSDAAPAPIRKRSTSCVTKIDERYFERLRKINNHLNNLEAKKGKK